MNFVTGWQLLRHGEDGPVQLQVQLREDPAAKSPALHRVRGASGREEKHQLAVRRILGLRIPGLDLLQSSKLQYLGHN